MLYGTLNISPQDLDAVVVTHEHTDHIQSIGNLSKKFNVLSRKFLPNYYETNVVEDNGDITYLFDFSRFFQKYLIYKKENKNNNP